MNREIKFKIYADNKFYDKCLVGNTNNTDDDKWTCPMIWLEDKKEWVHCDNGIILQYVGLKDKNGVEIYEGDIVKCYDEIGYVKYGEFNCNCCNGVYGWTIEPYNCCADLRNYKDLEVIGNIFENSELLEKRCKDE